MTEAEFNPQYALIELANFPNPQALLRFTTSPAGVSMVAGPVATLYQAVDIAYRDRSAGVDVRFPPVEDECSRGWLLYTTIRDLAAMEPQQLWDLLRRAESQPLLPLLHNRLTVIIRLLVEVGA